MRSVRLRHLPTWIVLFALLAPSVQAGSRFPGETWLRYDDPGEAGWSAEGLEEARKFSESIGSAAVLVVYRGAVVAAWGDVGRRYMCHSVRKSFMSAMVGVHVDSGRIDLEKRLADLGIDDIEPALTEEEKRAKIVDLLRARSGVYHLAAYEPATNPKPERGSHPPGTNWCYNNWDFNTLLTIFEQETGTRFFEEFARRIARPLGMQDFRVRDGYYHREPDKSMHPAYPFRMSARDMARFGLLFLEEGRWKGKRILSRKWVRDSVRPYSTDTWFGGYGYMWWIADKEPFARHGMYSALGLGDQSIDILPGLDMVFVHRTDTFAGNQVKAKQRLELLERILDAKTGKAVRRPRLSPMPEADRFTPIAMEPERLEEYAGSYIVPGFGRIEVSLEEDGLVAASRIGNFGLLPQSPDIFRMEDIGDSLAFRREDGELLTEVMLEGAMIGAGYRQLAQGNAEQAIAIFRRCTDFFPDSWNARDSLGEAYERNGERDLALESYRRSLELNPGNGNAREKLELLRDSME